MTCQPLQTLVLITRPSRNEQNTALCEHVHALLLMKHTHEALILVWQEMISAVSAHKGTRCQGLKHAYIWPPPPPPSLTRSSRFFALNIFNLFLSTNCIHDLQSKQINESVTISKSCNTNHTWNYTSLSTCPSFIVSCWLRERNASQAVAVPACSSFNINELCLQARLVLLLR